MSYRIFRLGLVVAGMVMAGSLIAAAQTASEPVTQAAPEPAAQAPAEAPPAAQPEPEAAPPDPIVIELDNGKVVNKKGPADKSGPITTSGGGEPGQPTKISVPIGDKKVRGIYVMQAPDGVELPPGARGDEARVVGGDATTKIIEVTPVSQGLVNVVVTVVYADGKQTQQLHVVGAAPPPLARQPQRRVPRF